MLWEVFLSQEPNSHALEPFYFEINLAQTEKCHYCTSKRQQVNDLKPRKQKTTLKMDALELNKKAAKKSKLIIKERIRVTPAATLLLKRGKTM